MGVGASGGAEALGTGVAAGGAEIAGRGADGPETEDPESAGAAIEGSTFSRDGLRTARKIE